MRDKRTRLIDVLLPRTSHHLVPRPDQDRDEPISPTSETKRNPLARIDGRIPRERGGGGGRRSSRRDAEDTVSFLLLPLRSGFARLFPLPLPIHRPPSESHVPTQRPYPTPPGAAPLGVRTGDVAGLLLLQMLVLGLDLGFSSPSRRLAPCRIEASIWRSASGAGHRQHLVLFGVHGGRRLCVDLAEASSISPLSLQGRSSTLAN
jgi:hypothetical protein